MTGYLLRRIGQALIVVVLVSLIVFVLLRLLPGGPARAILGPGATQEQVVQFNREQGFEQPIPLQYLSYAARVGQGDLGYSYRLNQNVVALITERLPKTLLLTILATLLGLLIALPLGIVQAVRRNKLVDYVATGVAFVLYAMPVFLLGLLLIILFSQTLGILPPQAPQGSSIGEVLSQADGLVLPVLTLALLTVATFSRYARSSTLDNLGEDYVRTARAKGALEGRVLSKHVTRNALVPIVTLLGLYVPYLFGGSLVTEATFNYPGMGLLFWDAAQNRDYPILLGVVLVISVATVVGSLLADLAYAWLDPRVRFSST
ncbi:ABC transporter permease [Flindersiella endophytica]